MARKGIVRTIKNSLRVEAIVVTLVKHGLGDFAGRLRLASIGRLLRFRPSSEADSPRLTRSQRVRRVLEELGPTFVKFGQIMSNRADILPPDLIEELSRLQDNCTPVPYPDVAEVFLKDRGITIGEVFAAFDETPIATASIAQVHEAWLAGGTRVAVKVQRPGIEAMIDRDLDVLDFFAALADKHVEEARNFDLPGLVAEFRKQITSELDFSREAHHLEQFAHTHRNDSNLVIPKVYERYSGRRVITLQYIQAHKLKDVLSGKFPADRGQIARRLANSMLEQIFIHGFFHADPHPGNILILSDGRVCFLDFGMMGRLSSREREQLARIMRGMATNDAVSVTDAIEDILGSLLERRDAFQAEVQDLIDIYMNRPLGEINIARVLEELIHLMRLHSIVIPSKFMLIARAFMIAEGVAFKLSPDFSFMTVFAPFSRRLIMEELKPRNLKRRLMEHGEAYSRALRELPLDAATALRLLKRGELRMGFRVQGITPLVETLDTVGTRFTFGLVLAATLISSSLIIHAAIPPFIFGIPAIGFAGFAIAGVMTLGFLLDLVLRMIQRAKKGD